MDRESLLQNKFDIESKLAGKIETSYISRVTTGEGMSRKVIVWSRLVNSRRFASEGKLARVYFGDLVQPRPA